MGSGDSVREWYRIVYDEAGAEGIPEDLTWNGLLGAVEAGQVQDIVPDTQAQGRCIRRLSETCRISIDALRIFKEGK